MKTKDITAPFGGPSELVFWSFRYFLGRMTIATCDFAEKLARVYPHLSLHVRELIERDLEREFEKDDEARERMAARIAKATNDEELLKARMDACLPLGHDCDRAAWEKVRAAYKKGAA